MSIFNKKSTDAVNFLNIQLRAVDCLEREIRIGKLHGLDRLGFGLDDLILDIKTKIVSRPC